MSVRIVVFHQPGASWVEGVDFREQKGVEAHVQHYAQLLQRGSLQMGGPFLDGVGGMMIAAEGVRREDIQAFAEEDPAVQSGLLTFTVREWYVPMSAS